MLLCILVGNLVFALWSTLVFLVFLHVPVHLWLLLNICAPTQYITIVAMVFELKNKRYLSWQIAMACFLFRFGTGGMFVFPWDGYMLTSQFSHIFMTLLALFIIYIAVVSEDPLKKKKTLLGLIIGIIIILMIDLVVFPIGFMDPIAVEMMESMGFSINY